jgi:hypothetical protein
MLATARGIAAGKSPRTIAAENDIHTEAVIHYRRRLRHLRITADDVSGDVDIAALIKQRRSEQKQRSKAARKAVAA